MNIQNIVPTQNSRRLEVQEVNFDQQMGYYHLCYRKLAVYVSASKNVVYVSRRD